MDAARAGRVVGGKYEVLTLVGEGGMSRVWLARDLGLGKLWALKEVRAGASAEQTQANRKAILDEANFMKRLDHPAIPRVVDMLAEDGATFVVMDYVEGRSLGAVLRERGRLTQEEAVDVGLQLCDVLSYLHGRTPAVVYRDLKPSNVMLREDGSVRLVDFGIAEELLGGRDDGRVIGSAGYSAPEQVSAEAHEAHPTDTRADVYALGTTLYSLLTGIVPRRVEAPDGSVGHELDLRPLRQVDPGLSDGLERVLALATRRDPAERYQTMGEMRYDLAHHEELTEAHRASLRRKVRLFRGRLACAVALACLGAACLGGRLAVREGSREALAHEAAAASTAGTGEGGQGPSEAERLLGRAIEASPSTLDTYESLLGVYRADQVLTPSESARWMRVWKDHGQALEADGRYARLCYDVGVLYLCYYDGRDAAPRGELPVEGQGAVERVTRSAEWFSRARAACDPGRGDYRGLAVGDSLDEYAATLAYGRIAEFHTRFEQAGREGRDLAGPYQDFWQGLAGALEGPGEGPAVAERAEPIVCLRLCQVACEALRSPTYLAGLMRAGVSEEEARRLLACVRERTDGLEGFAESNQGTAAALWREVSGGLPLAEDNVSRTFGSPVVRMGAGGASGGGGGGA